ncbi:ABC transporter permease [Desulfobulbus sp.]|uniref:ABC transporter permease n=1 Tax=Desulfobulbus sp. TaxID=895 RepID=UPI00286F17FF|nr:ABC transporter permease [Desulfobulbus sp.]
MQLWRQKRNLLTLVKGDFTQNHLSSYLGFAWAIIGPVVSLTVISLVFQFGLRVATVNESGLPFVAWLACGLVPWYYFADGAQSGASSVVSYSFLVRKATFRMSYLPGIRLCALAVIHLSLMCLLLGILLYFDMFPSLYWLQWFYYFPLMFLFLLGLTWATSALTVFIPDAASVLGIGMNLGFWATPIVWNPAMLPPKYHWFFTANPAYYIIQGYRNTFVEPLWFWQRPLLDHLFFFAWLSVVVCAGAITFKRLRPHFADVI